MQTGVLGVISEDLKDDYFVLKDMDKYTDEMGLELGVEYGAAVFG